MHILFGVYICVVCLARKPCSKKNLLQVLLLPRTVSRRQKKKNLVRTPHLFLVFTFICTFERHFSSCLPLLPPPRLHSHAGCARHNNLSFADFVLYLQRSSPAAAPAVSRGRFWLSLASKKCAVKRRDLGSIRLSGPLFPVDTGIYGRAMYLVCYAHIPSRYYRQW